MLTQPPMPLSVSAVVKIQNCRTEFARRTTDTCRRCDHPSSMVLPLSKYRQGGALYRTSLIGLNVIVVTSMRRPKKGD